MWALPKRLIELPRILAGEAFGAEKRAVALPVVLD